ncbi:MAG: tetratricopeptide repeat protein [Pseudomonadota bacterium]
MINKAIQQDARGNPMSACLPETMDDFETALYQFQSYFGDPTETLTRALEREPEFVMGHIFNACAMLMTSEREYLPMVRESIEAAEALAHKSNDREKALTAAARHWMEGRWDQACVTWDQVLGQYPRDAMAIQLGHLTDFYLGDATNLRDRVGRVIGSWDESTPGYSFILGMQAFGLEECNQFDRAEATAMKALSINPRDGWSVHAVAHVMEMQNRYEEGQRFLRHRVDDWAPDSGFAFHNWWHLALFYMEQEDFATAIQLYDEQILLGDTEVSLEMCDASALLWRLQLQDVDVGERWNKIAELWANKTPGENGYYAFNDLHAIIALVGANRLQEARTVLDDLRLAVESNPRLTGMMAQYVGVPAACGIIAFAEQRYTDAVDALLPVRGHAARFGGSNAQRDILSQTLIESAIRAGQAGLARNLVGEREVHKPFSPLTKRFKAKLTH